MDEVVRKSIQAAESKTRTSVPWKCDEPWSQPYYIHGREGWKAAETESTTSGDSATTSLTNLALYSWNIDFMLPFPDSRMRIAINHLQQLVTGLSESTASVVFLQECVESDLELLASNKWVQKHYALSDIGISNWQSGHYGTVTLMDRRLLIKSCFRVHYSETRMQRDGLFVDVLFKQKSIRLCNTHLESLALEPPRRPPQMEIVSRYMHDTEVEGAAVAGDFNAIQDFDRKLHEDNNLKDAYLDLGGDEYDVSNHTWGQQAATDSRNRFGTSRMDKVFFCGELHCAKFERFGSGIELEDEKERAHIVALGFDRPWITDHLGVLAVFDVQNDQAQAMM